MEENFLTDLEKQSIKVLNEVATYDGVIRDEDSIIWILAEGISKFIARKRQSLVHIDLDSYPIKIKYEKSNGK